MEIQQMLSLRERLQSVSDKIEGFCHHSRRQRFLSGNRILLVIFQEIPDVLGILFEHMQELNGEEPIFDTEGISLLMQQLQKAREAQDYVLMADIFQWQLQPLFLGIQERLALTLGVQIDEKLFLKNIRSCQQNNPQLLYSLLPEELVRECFQSDEGIADSCMERLVELVERCLEKGYAVEPTSGGHYTLAVRKGDYNHYLHTNGNVVSEALMLAEEWLAQEKENYIFYGLGLGYAYVEMLSMDYNISIRVLDTNRELLLLAMVFAPLWKLFDSGRFELIYDPTGYKIQKLSVGIQEDTGFYIFYPALQGIKKPALKGQLEVYFVEESSVRTQSRTLQGNFRRNTQVSAGNIRQLISLFSGREVIIVAAGPSLDKNMELLKNRGEGVILLAVGTVLKKLLRAGIRPDYVIMTDASDTVYLQIQGAEDCLVPLLFLSTVFSRVPEAYQGEKYLLCQKDFPPAEALAEEKQWMTVESGGSVTTVALDLCLRLEVERIVFVGLDLAFTGAMDHARDTGYQAKAVQDTGIYVESVGGGTVATGKNLKAYLDWIERRIARRTEREERIPIVDATEGGARKRGMQVMSLEKALEDGNRKKE